MTVTRVAFTTVIDVTTVSPNIRDKISDKLVPVIETIEPPPIGPLDGVTLAIVGTLTTMNPPILVADPPGVVNSTSTIPTAFGGLITVTDLSLTLMIEVPATPSNITAVVPAKSFPLIITVVPPAVGPVSGFNDLIVGTMT